MAKKLAKTELNNLHNEFVICFMLYVTWFVIQKAIIKNGSVELLF